MSAEVFRNRWLDHISLVCSALTAAIPNWLSGHDFKRGQIIDPNLAMHKNVVFAILVLSTVF